MSEAEDIFAGAHRILIVQLSAIGDVLRAGSVVAAFKRVYPSVRVGMLVFSDYEDVLAGIPGLSYRHVFGNLSLKQGIGAARDDDGLSESIYRHAYLPLQEIQPRNYDVAVNFHFSTISAYLTAMSGARKLLGMAPSADGPIDVFGAEAYSLYDDLRSPDRMARSMEHLAVRYHKICGLPEDDVRLDYQVEHPIAKSAPRRVAVHVGAGWKDKCWPAAQWRDLLLRIHHGLGWIPVLFGTAAERDRNFADVLSAWRSSAVPVIDFCGRPFSESARVLAACDLFIGADSGPMHLASALDVPAVALFGPTSAFESYPLRGRNAVIKKRSLADIEVDEVWRAVLAVAKEDAAPLPTWQNACKTEGVILYENPHPQFLSHHALARGVISRATYS